MKTTIIVTGKQGSGKTTYIRNNYSTSIVIDEVLEITPAIKKQINSNDGKGLVLEINKENLLYCISELKDYSIIDMDYKL